MIPLIGAVLPIVGKVIDKLIPDIAEREKAKMEIQLKLVEQEGELIKSLTQTDIAQAEVNKAEAGSENLFKSGWRPAIAWCCAIGFAWNIFLPVVGWGLQIAGYEIPAVPNIGGEMLISMTFGMLGLGALRTYEKKVGVTK